MIIGIDDSGNFETDDLSFFAAALIRPTKYKKIERVFIEGEAQLPDSVRGDGEVKGYLLSSKQLEDLADRVLINNGYGAIKIQTFAVQISEANTGSLLHERDRNIDQLTTGARDIYRNKGKEYIQIATQYEQTAEWLRAKSVKTLYKIKLLGLSIVRSMNLAIMTSVDRDFDKELGAMK